MLNLGSAFEAAVAAALGIDPNSYDPGSLSIDLVNPGGSATTTTIRFTVHWDVPTATVKQFIINHAQ